MFTNRMSYMEYYLNKKGWTADQVLAYMLDRHLTRHKDKPKKYRQAIVANIEAELKTVLKGK